MKSNCDICGADIEVYMCCDGSMCGCMGMPVEPPVCSTECYDIYMERNNIVPEVVKLITPEDLLL